MRSKKKSTMETGSLTSVTASSTTDTQHEKHGQMQFTVILHAASENNNASIRHAWARLKCQIAARLSGERRTRWTNPTNQRTTPTMERTSDRKAKGRESRNPRGLQPPNSAILDDAAGRRLLRRLPAL